jgi:hypothetical protein
MRQLPPKNIPIYLSAARTATPTAVVVNNSEGYRGAYLIVDVTAGAATPSVTPKLEIHDNVSGNYVQFHENISAITSTSADTYIYWFCPSAEETEGTGGCDMILNAQLPLKFKITFTHGDTDSLTYSVGLQLLP